VLIFVPKVVKMVLCSFQIHPQLPQTLAQKSQKYKKKFILVENAFLAISLSF